MSLKLVLGICDGCSYNTVHKYTENSIAKDEAEKHMMETGHAVDVKAIKITWSLIT